MEREGDAKGLDRQASILWYEERLTKFGILSDGGTGCCTKCGL